MKKISLFLSLFLSLQVSLFAQTYYITGTTIDSLGNRPLIHKNELRIGISTLPTERAKNMIKIGDGSYIQIGEWEADDMLSFKASRYNFTNGKVGIGTTSPNALLEVSGNNPAFILRGNPTYLQIGVPSASGNCAPYSKRGDIVFRPLSGVDGHAGLIFNIPVDDADGKSYIKFGDDKNHGWFSLYNNKIAVINGKVGIGVENPTQALDVNGTVKATALSLTGALTTHSLTTGGDLQIGNEEAPANSYAKKLYFGLPSENGDGFFISRFNLEYDKSELRVNMGNDYNDKFVVGRKFWDQPDFEPMFTVVTNGNVGIGGNQPQFPLDILNTSPNTTKAALARLSERTHTYLGVKSYNSQPTYCKMFAIEQIFYNKLNAAINFYRGGSDTDGFITISLKGNDICKFNYRGLDVYGILQAKEVKISETGWADFVFNDDYRLKPLSEVNTFIKENKHLPEIPSATEVKENEGVNLGEMQVKLLQKIEELTLYLIQQDNKIQVLESELNELKNK